MDFSIKYKFEISNTDKHWEDKCSTCCIIKCGMFGDFKKQCHCFNFKKRECKKCKYRDMSF